jgi:hypothetical protein
LNFKQLIAKYVSGNLRSDQLSEIGIAGLYEGLDTPSLCILAGLDKNENSFVADRYLKLTLEELRIPLPDKRQAALIYALGITEDIIELKLNLIAGVTEINEKALGSHDFWSENKHYVYDSIAFEMVYGLYYDYDDLTSKYVPKCDPEKIVEVKKLLFDALVIWREKLKLLCD